jgi:aldehyde dehydrogenase (NAD+)
VIPYEDDDDAVRIANDSSYGLSGMVMGGSLDRATAVAKRIRTGTVGVNGGSYYAPDVPFGGFKDSGVGRQNGIQGFDQYLEVQSLALPAD